MGKIVYGSNLEKYVNFVYEKQQFFGVALSNCHEEKLLNIFPVMKFVYIKKSLSGKNNLKFLHLFLEAVLGDIYRSDFFSS